SFATATGQPKPTAPYHSHQQRHGCPQRSRHMSSFRVIDPFAYFDEALAIGGSAELYEAGTTTPADVFADPDLTVNNGSTVSVGTDGRLTKETWGDATKSYRVRIYKQDGTLIRDRDNIGVSGAGGLTIPSLVPGQFLTNNGTALDWEAI